MMRWLLLCIPLTIAVAPPKCGVPGKTVNLKERSKRILGGGTIQPAEMPWIVALKERDSSTFCTGSLISDRHVLTAAHCFMMGGFCENLLNHKPINQTSICHGVAFNDVPCKGEGVQEYKPKRALNLEAFFDAQCTKNDFVILELENPVPNAMPVCLPLEENQKDAANNGNGDLISAGYSPNYESHEVPLPLGMSRELRASIVGERVECNPEDSEDVICAKQTNQGAICRGDSGGPLMQIRDDRFTIVGVHSTANFTQCYPSGLYSGIRGIQKSTDVFKHLPEIQEAMKSNP